MKKLLVTGISGFLGSALTMLNPDNWQIIGLYNNNPVSNPNITTIKTNISSPLAIKKIFYKVQPDAVLHLAAMANPNFCENNEALSQQINVNISLELALLCKANSIPFLFVSSDLVFDGNHAPYHENAATNPISIYGQHKALAEKLILENYSDACIARCPVMYGIPQWGNSFMKSWLENLRTGKDVFAFTDEFRTKVSGKTAMQGLLQLLDQNKNGIWHLGGKESISRFDFAIKMAKVYGLSTELIRPSVRADVKMPAARPADVSLDSSKAFENGYNPPSIEEELVRMREENTLF